MSLTLKTPPGIEPVTVDEVKLFSRISTSDEDITLALLIKAARIAVEKYTRRCLVEQTWEMRLDHFPNRREIEIPKPPLQSAVITYLDVTGDEQTFAAQNYTVDTTSTPGRIVLNAGAEWPETLEKVNAVTIEFVCGAKVVAAEYPGAPDTVDVGEDFKIAVLLKFADFYEHRDKVMEQVLSGSRLFKFGE